MEKKARIGMIILFILLIAVACMVVVKRMNNIYYILNLPQQESLKSISVKGQNKQKEVIDSKEIQDIIYVLNDGDKGRTTRKNSISDYPVNASNIIEITCNFIESGTSKTFIYKKNNNCYLEQPFNGVYRISADEYNSIEKYIM